MAAFSRFDGWSVGPMPEIPEPVRLLAEVDQGVERAVRMIEPIALGIYQTVAPGRVGAAVVARIKDTDGWRLTIVVAAKGMAVPIGYWTNLGTGVYRPGGKPIRRRRGGGQQRGARGRYSSTEGPSPPFNVRGRLIPEFKGQPAQHWVDDARRQADARARVIVEQFMPEQVTDQVRRWLG